VNPNAPRLRHLDLNLLRVFDVVMTERNLTRAAHRLSMTQPAVSNALRRLRDALGDDLLRRVGGAMEPTPRALALWPAVSDALRQLDQALVPGAFVAAQARNVFVLAMSDATAAELMPGLVAIIEADAPGVTVRVLPLATRDPRRLLDTGEVDLAVGYFPAALAELAAQSRDGVTAAFDHLRLYESEYVCVMRRGHPLADVPLTLDRYCSAHHLLVSFTGRPFGFVDEALAALGRQRRIVLTVNQFFTAGRVVAASDLLTVLPRHFVGAAGMAEALQLRPLPLSLPPVHVEAMWHHRQGQRADHAWLRLAVQAAAVRAFGAEASEPAAAARQRTTRR